MSPIIEATETAKKLIDGCERITDKFKKWLNDSDYYTAPASRQNHSAFKGGLIVHSVNVYKRLLQYNEAYATQIPEDSMIIIGLFHDLCKVYFYGSEKRNRKNKETGRWEEYDCYTIEDKFPLPHGSKSVVLLHSFLSLSSKEALAVSHHMGAWDVQDYSKKSSLGEAMHMTEWCLALQVADQQSTFIDKI